jgi:hypothetical protein
MFYIYHILLPYKQQGKFNFTVLYSIRYGNAIYKMSVNKNEERQKVIVWRLMGYSRVLHIKLL